MKKLTRRQAWERIKLAFQRYGGPLEILNISGLCYAVKYLTVDGQITGRVARRMEKDIEATRPKRAAMRAWFWSKDKSGAEQRVRAINKILKQLC